MLPTLDEFLTEKTFRNSYVREPGFSHLYVRLGPRFLYNIKYENVLDIANLEAEVPGAGAFTRLSQRLLAQGYILYVESVMQPRFAHKLLELGFHPAHHPDCFYKFPEGTHDLSNDEPAVPPSLPHGEAQRSPRT